LAVIEGEYTATEFAEWDFYEILEYISEDSYVWSAYSGSGDSPVAIGISIDSWPYWEFEGPEGIIASAQIIEPTDKEIKAFKSKIPKDVIDILKKNGFIRVESYGEQIFDGPVEDLTAAIIGEHLE